MPAKNSYPRAGTANAKVRLGIVGRTGGETRWVEWDREKYPYLARVVWKKAAAPLCLLVQNRVQQEEVLLAVDPSSGVSDPNATVSATQSNLHTDVIVTTALPHAILKHRLGLLIGAHWSLHDVQTA